MLTSLLYLGLVAAQYLDGMPYWIANHEVQLPTLRFAQYTLAINVFGFLAVGMLAGSLAERLRSADARLVVASNQIEDLRAYNEHVIDSLLSGLVTTDIEGRVLTFNRAASAITGVHIDHAVGHDIHEVLQLQPAVRTDLAALVQTRSLRVEVEYRTGQGRLLDIGVMVTLIGFPNGRNGYLFTFQDVTGAQAARAQRQAAAASGGGGRDGRRDCARNPEPAGVDVRFDAGTAAGTAVERRPGAAHGHRAS